MAALLATLAGCGLGLVLLAPSWTARQLALARLLIRAAEQPGAGPVVPDPRGPLSRHPYLALTLAAVGLLLAAPATIGLALEELDGAQPLTAIAFGATALALIALPCLLIAHRRWQTATLPRLGGQVAPDPDLIRRTPAAPAAGRPRRRPAIWLLVLGTAALMVSAGFVPDARDRPLPRGSALTTSVEGAVILGSVLVIGGAVILLVVRLVRSVTDLRAVDRAVRAAGPWPIRPAPGPGAVRATAGATEPDPARQLCLTLAGVWVVAAEWLVGLNRVAAVRSPTRSGLSDLLPLLNQGWVVALGVIVATTALACRYASRTRNRLRGAITAGG